MALERYAALARDSPPAARRGRVERVAVVQRDLGLRGSIERDAALLVRELVALGIGVHVYCNPDTRDEDLDGVVYHDVRPVRRASSRPGRAVEVASFAAAATRAVRADALRWPYDVVDVNSVAAWGCGIVRVHEVTKAAQLRWPHEVGASFTAPRLRSTAAPLLWPEVGVRRAIQRLQFRSGAFAGALAVSDEVRDDLIETFGVPPERVSVVPLAVALEAVPPEDVAALRTRLGVGAAPLLLFVGHAFRRKGLVHAIDALAGLRSDVRLVVVGAPRESEQREAAARARAAGVADRVVFAGRTDPSPYYATADVLVLPTSHDAWGIPVIEAMASGVPVVTTRAAGSATELERARAGLVVPDAGPRVLRDAVAALLADADRRRSMGERGRRAASRFTPRARAELTLEAYERFGAADERGSGRRRLRVSGGGGTRTIASFPSVQEMNPYQRLLYRHLRAEGFELDSGARLSLRWLWAARRSRPVLHVHWPESLYRLGRGPVSLRPAGSWLKLGLFALRLRAARALGYRIAWTVHQVHPHGSGGRRLDRLGAVVLGRAAHVLIAHDGATRERVAAALGPAVAARVRIVPHGSYVGVYPPGRPRGDVRRELGLAADAFVFLCFGELRAGKSWRAVVRAFRALERPGAALVLAGLVRSPGLFGEVWAEAGGDPRIRLLLRYVGDEEVSELFAACDVAVAPREDGGTSGSLVLPLSLGLPVVACDRPAYRDLTGGEAAGWLFRPGDEDSLRDALDRAASDPGEARRRGDAALERARRLRWTDVAAATARVLREGRA